ncbi:MAG: hypothetical protein IT314_04455 [Anaerolineales bacterium]|nr:hypothetical protein [Anaerolineales bacterium]
MRDVTIPDDSIFAPGSRITKVWRLKNSGTCTWTTNYRIVFVGGTQMGGQNFMPLPTSVAPGQTIDIPMNFIAPVIVGEYRGNWQIRNERGEIFGTSSAANQPFWLSIRVQTPALSGLVYDFVANACSAQWFNEAGTRDCPGVNNDKNGFILRQTNAKLEDGSTLPRPSLLTAPQNITNGYLRGVYPSFKVQNGDRLQAIVNCEGGATSCGVLFRIDYQLSDGIVREFWAFGEQYDRKYFVADLDLSPLAGQDVQFVFTVLSLGSASGDRALWVEPRIVRNLIIPTPTP